MKENLLSLAQDDLVGRDFEMRILGMNTLQ